MSDEHLWGCPTCSIKHSQNKLDFQLDEGMEVEEKAVGHTWDLPNGSPYGEEGA